MNIYNHQILLKVKQIEDEFAFPLLAINEEKPLVKGQNQHIPLLLMLSRLISISEFKNEYIILNFISVSTLLLTPVLHSLTGKQKHLFIFAYNRNVRLQHHHVYGVYLTFLNPACSNIPASFFIPGKCRADSLSQEYS